MALQIAIAIPNKNNNSILILKANIIGVQKSSEL